MTKTFHGRVEDTLDALLLIEACQQNILPKISRRLLPSERDEPNLPVRPSPDACSGANSRLESTDTATPSSGLTAPRAPPNLSLIIPGSVFVYDETESGISRWTDGKIWSPSRICGNFLVYNELYRKLPNQRTWTSKDRAEMKSGAALRDQALRQKVEQDGLLVMSGGKGTFVLKKDGLIKKTISVKGFGSGPSKESTDTEQKHRYNIRSKECRPTLTETTIHRLVCYERPGAMENLNRPRDYLELRNLLLSKSFITMQNFRNPLKILPLRSDELPLDPEDELISNERVVEQLVGRSHERRKESTASSADPDSSVGGDHADRKRTHHRRTKGCDDTGGPTQLPRVKIRYSIPDIVQELESHSTERLSKKRRRERSTPDPQPSEIKSRKTDGDSSDSGHSRPGLENTIERTDNPPNTNSVQLFAPRDTSVRLRPELDWLALQSTGGALIGLTACSTPSPSLIGSRQEKTVNATHWHDESGLCNPPDWKTYCGSVREECECHTEYIFKPIAVGLSVGPEKTIVDPLCERDCQGVYSPLSPHQSRSFSDEGKSDLEIHGNIISTSSTESLRNIEQLTTIDCQRDRQATSTERTFWVSTQSKVGNSLHSPEVASRNSWIFPYEQDALIKDSDKSRLPAKVEYSLQDMEVMNGSKSSVSPSGSFWQVQGEKQLSKSEEGLRLNKPLPTTGLVNFRSPISQNRHLHEEHSKIINWCASTGCPDGLCTGLTSQCELQSPESQQSLGSQEYLLHSNRSPLSLFSSPTSLCRWTEAKGVLMGHGSFEHDTPSTVLPSGGERSELYVFADANGSTLPLMEFEEHDINEGKKRSDENVRSSDCFQEEREEEGEEEQDEGRREDVGRTQRRVRSKRATRPIRVFPLLSSPLAPELSELDRELL